MMITYREGGKVRWAKHSWFQPYEDFAGILLRAFASSIYYVNIDKYSRENFRGALNNRESSVNRTFPRLW